MCIRDRISSVSVKKLPKGSGIKVEILTPENITSITQSQYTNAAITSGITDAEIKVASPTKVTGESALVGVYKACLLYTSLSKPGRVLESGADPSSPLRDFFD